MRVAIFRGGSDDVKWLDPPFICPLEFILQNPAKRRTVERVINMSGSISFNMNSSKKGPKLAFGLKSQQKAPMATTAFTPDSDEDDEEQRQDNKRQRRAFSGF